MAPPKIRPSRPLWQRLVPGVQVMRNYQRGWIKGDVIAGITVAAYLIPQVMAFASIVGLPAVVGLWAVLGPMDRKSTRLNSSHVASSYAVFCLKKKIHS